LEDFVALVAEKPLDFAPGSSSAASRHTFSEQLYDWRKRNDLSQSEAALRLNVSKRTLKEWNTVAPNRDITDGRYRGSNRSTSRVFLA